MDLTQLHKLAELDGVEIIAVLVALLSLVYTIYSNKQNTRRNVMPYINVERAYKGDTDTTKVFIDKYNNKKIIETKDWSETHKQIIENKQETMYGLTSEPPKNYPILISLTNVGLGIATRFTIKIDKNLYTWSMNFSTNNKMTLEVLMEKIPDKVIFDIEFYDIYGTKYKEKIEIYKGHLKNNIRLKSVRFAKVRDFIQEWQERKNI
ncbi:hypothetical protein PDI73_09945 [Lactococcus lactis]|uniref:hypothetical protein n=1 Tax=Lactococcus lactis TaxID=1358 RepID=UPI00240D73A0|nr:hypothetical protein [Lactococcus lactis]WFB95672.1 hypothetical protein PDI73_09945 [Lactococcus lactis]